MMNTNKILREFNNEYLSDLDVLKKLEPYILSKEQQVKVFLPEEGDLLCIDVDWSYKFQGKKQERTKVVNFLKKEGFIFSKENNEMYLRVTDEVREKLTSERKKKFYKRMSA
jgi:hypothetical protein